MNNSQVALQLYTVRDETQRDFVATLRAVGQMGYAAVEFAGYGGMAAGELASLLSNLNLKVAGTHVALARLEQDLDQELDYCVEIGCPFLIVPWLPPEQRTPAAVRTLVPRFNKIGERCRERNVTFAYHNHNFEFERHDGRYLLDDLLRATDHSLVLLEFDAYWAAYAGVNPVEYLQHHVGRVPLLHVKDMTAERTFAEVGAGTMDYKAIFAAAQDGGTCWYIVENDQPQIPSLESARRSLQYIRRNLVQE